VTECAGHGRVWAREALQSGTDLVIAWGGDGTVNEVASMLVGTTVPLGIVAGGSGNGLARELGIPTDPARALAIAFARQTRSIDVGTLAGRHFINVAGFGFDARVAQRFNAGEHARGLMRYVRLTLLERFSYEPQRYRIRWDEGAFDGGALIVACANSRQYGNGASIAPMARFDDGWLDLVIVEPVSPWRDIWRARRLFTRTLLQDGHARSARVRRVTLDADAPVPCHVDGEPFTADPPIDIRIQPGALLVCERRDSP
jgi:YegS/Rv2252/BmrU family lipid kinase